jgi:hypothetical protein
VARPDRQPDLFELLEVAHGRVDEHRRDPAMLRLRGQQLADEGHRPGLGHRHDEHLTRLCLCDGGMHHEVVVLAAAHRPGRTCCTRARQHLNEIDVDDGRSRGGFVDCRGPQCRQRCIRLTHRASTT